MRMSTALVNGSEAENHGHKQNHSDVVSHFESSKMKNIAPPPADFDKSLSSRVSETDEVNHEESSGMKDLLLIHLDLIQQQAEQLSKKSKLVDSLKNENETLKLRLTRMERRVSLQRNRGERKQSQPTSNESAEVSRKRIKTEPTSSPAQVSGKKSFIETNAKKMRIDKIDLRKIKIEPDENENEAGISLEGKLTSAKAYYTFVGELQKYVSNHSLCTSKLKVEVPQWRIKTVTPLYTTEKIEELMDDTYDKRHTKLLVDEKRRKRWDVQRIREQRNIEKLRSREGGEKVNEQPACTSLWHQNSDGLRLFVTPVVPVSAFGINLPSVTRLDFALPWKEGSKSKKKNKR